MYEPHARHRARVLVEDVQEVSERVAPSERAAAHDGPRRGHQGAVSRPAGESPPRRASPTPEWWRLWLLSAGAVGVNRHLVSRPAAATLTGAGAGGAAAAPRQSPPHTTTQQPAQSPDKGHRTTVTMTVTITVG